MLFAAAYSNDMAVLQHALSKKVDIDGLHTQWNMTALHEAAQRGHEAIVKSLLQHKANAFIRNKRNQTAMELALLCGQSHCIDILSDHMDEVREGFSKNVSAANAHATDAELYEGDRELVAGDRSPTMERLADGANTTNFPSISGARSRRCKSNGDVLSLTHSKSNKMGTSLFERALLDNDKIARLASSTLYRRRPIFKPPPRKTQSSNSTDVVKKAREHAKQTNIALHMLASFRRKPPGGSLTKSGLLSVATTGTAKKKRKGKNKPGGKERRLREKGASHRSPKHKRGRRERSK